MNPHKFPFETPNPVVDGVVLPVGVHVLKLVVVDDAGTMSAPDHVVIRVEPPPKPIIHDLTPDHLRKGEATNAVLHGHHLSGVISIKVFRDAHEDDCVEVAVRPGGAADRLPLTMTVMDHARSGVRTLVVTTAGGVATVKFVIVAGQSCRIRKLTPHWGYAGLGPLAARIDGDDLESANAVVFVRGDQPDNAIKATIRDAQPDFVDVDLTISANAEFGPRHFSVTTPAGTTKSPPGVSFTVLPGYLASGVILLTLVTAFVHLTLHFPNLLFILNGLGYLVLLLGLYAPTHWLMTGLRPWMRWVLLVYTLLTIVSWLAIGDRTALAYVTKAVELLLVLLLFAESRQP